MCFFVNEKLQLLDGAALVAKKPSRGECCLTVDPSYFPQAHPIKRVTAGFPVGCSQERDGRGKTKKISLPGVGEKAPPQTKRTLVLFQFGSFKNTHKTSLRSVHHEHTEGSLQRTQVLLNVEKIKA